MSLLRQDQLELVSQQALRFDSRLGNALRVAMFGIDGSQAPASMVDIRKQPDGPQVWKRFLEKQARQEQEGFAPGDLGTQAAEHPAVQQELMGPDGGQ